MGTAPGMWFERDGKVVISLPGVPYEMISIFESAALPKLRSHFPSGAVVHRTIVTAGEGESFVAQQIEAEEAALPAHIKLAFLPHPGGVRLRLTGLGEDELKLIKEVEARRDEICAKLEKIVVATEDLPLEHLVGKALVSKGATLGLAESCTGGYIAHKITQIMGSAQYLQGGVVCYQESVKEELLYVKRSTIDKHCVVSEEVAVEMAKGARKALESDYGFGITGLLSAGGVDAVPVGTVCMAVCSGEELEVKTFTFHMDRLRNKELAVQNALLMILRFVQRIGKE
jgi:nicotinamide-nucleotide amidase